MIEAAIEGLFALLTVESLLYMVIGVLFGVFIGILPGLGGVAAMALLLPFAFGLDPAPAFAMLLGAHVATIYNDAVTGILFNVPGASKGIAMCFDGFPMTQRGEAARALGATAFSSLTGSLLGVVILILILPVIRAIMLALGPPEYFFMGMWALVVIAVFSQGSVLKGLAAGGIGLTLAFVGQDPVTATARFTFDSIYLLDGLDIAVVAIGLFAISQMISLYIEGGAVVKRRAEARRSSVLDGVRDVIRHWRVVAQSSLLGMFIGSFPGIGAEVTAFAAYGQAAQTSKSPERFGKGAVEGLIAPSSTLGANEAANLIPTLGFGIPGGEGMAILLSALIVQGIAPGREMLTTNLALVFTMIWTIVIANTLTTGIGLYTARYFARLTSVPGNRLIPLVLAVCFVGVFAINRRVADVVVAGIFGVVGFFLKRYGYSLGDLMVGFVLGTILERYLQISLTLYGPLFWLTRPVSVVLVLLIAVTLVWPVYQRRNRRQRSDSLDDAENRT